MKTHCDFCCHTAPAAVITSKDFGQAADSIHTKLCEFGLTTPSDYDPEHIKRDRKIMALFEDLADMKCEFWLYGRPIPTTVVKQ